MQYIDKKDKDAAQTVANAPNIWYIYRNSTNKKRRKEVSA